MPTIRKHDLLLLSFLYFPLNLFWTAMMSQLLAVRVQEVAGMSHRALVMGFIESGGAIVATIVMLIIGPLSDNTTHHRGRRYPWVLGGVALGAVASLGFSLSNTVAQLLLAFVLVRAGLHAAVAAYEALVPDRVPINRQGEATGFAEMWDVLGMVCGLLLTSLLTRGIVSSLLGTKLSPTDETRVAVFIICALAAGLFFLCLWLNLRWICGPPLPKEASRPWLEVLRSAFRWNPRETPDFTRLFISRCVLSCGIYIGFTYIRYFVDSELNLNGMDPTLEVRNISLIFAAGGIIGALLGVRLGDRVSKVKLLYIFCSIAALAAVGFCLTESTTVARYMAFGFGIGYTAITAVDWAFATNLVPQGKEGRYLAIFQCAMTVPQIFVGLLGGIIGQHFGFRALFWTIPIFLIVGVLILRGVKEPKFELAS